MNRFILFSIILANFLLLPFQSQASVTAEILSDTLTENITDPDDGNREYFSISYNIVVRNAKDHNIRIEYQLNDAQRNKVYFDDEELAYDYEEYEITADVDTISGYMGIYYDSLNIKPGPAKLFIKFKLFDETTGTYVTPFTPKTHEVNFVSQQPAPGIIVKSQYIEHNVYIDGAKCMKVHYDFKADWYKDVPIKVVVQLYKKNGTPIYTTKGGGVDKVEATRTSNYTHSNWDNQWCWFNYGRMNLPRGVTDCYAKITFYNAKTGKPIPTTGNNKINFTITRN